MKWYICLAIALIGMGISLGYLGAHLKAPSQYVSFPIGALAESGDPEVRVQGVWFVEQVETARVLTLSAEAVAWYESGQFAVVRQVRAQFFPSRTAPLIVEANAGRIASPTGNLNLQGQVRVQHPAGYTLTTEALSWQASSRTLYTDEPVSMHNATVRITGKGLRGAVDQQRFFLLRHVQASFQLS
jgi:LPS export ABC transporter protein LptC